MCIGVQLEEPYDPIDTQLKAFYLNISVLWTATIEMVAPNTLSWKDSAPVRNCITGGMLYIFLGTWRKVAFWETKSTDPSKVIIHHGEAAF